MTVNIAVFGATGQVGSVMRSLLESRNFPVGDIRFFATKNSAGKTLLFNGQKVNVEDIEKRDYKGIDIALMSIGADASKEFSPLIAKDGAIVIDNSKAYRMDPDVPLVVAEVNPEDLDKIPKNIVANPNCTTMVAMVVIAPLDKAFGLKALNVCSYQAVSGAGRDGVKEFIEEIKLIDDPYQLVFENSLTNNLASHVKIFPDVIAFNTIPLAGSLLDDGSKETTEEQKLRDETRKILHKPDLSVGAICVRVPVFTGHCLGVTALFDKTINTDDVIKVLQESMGVTVDELPTALKATGQNNVFVGRIKKNQAFEKAFDMFIAGDNLKKGAALNAVQIAEILVEKF